MFCCCFLFIYLLLTIPFRPIIYRTDLRQIFRVGRTMAVDDQSEVSFSIPKGRCHSNQFSLVLSAELVVVAGERRRLVAQPGGLKLGLLVV